MRENYLGMDKLVLAIMLLGMEPLMADEWEVKGRIDQEFSYDDNVTMREDPEASLIYAITPELSFLHRTDVSEISANASYGIQRYFDISMLDRNNQNYGVDGKYFTDSTVWKLSVNYGLTPSRDVAEQESGDFDINTEREVFSVEPSVVYQISERDKLFFSTRYSDIGYSSNFLSDYRDWGINLKWSRQWSERYTSSFDMFYSNFDSERSSSSNEKKIESDSFGANLSSTYLYSEKWTIFGTAGVRFTETQSNDSLSRVTKDSSVGFLLDAGLDYTGESLLAKLNFSHSLMPSSRGLLNEQSKVTFDLKYELTERLSASLLSSFQRTKPVGDSSGGNKRTNFTVNPSISLMITPDWVLSTSYRYRYQERNISNFEETANSNLYMMSLNYNWQGLSMAR